MPKYKAVLCDVDDTLLKTWETKWRQHKYVASRYYGIDLTDKILREHWGKPFDDMIAALYQNKGTAADRRTNFLRHELEFPKSYQPYALEFIEGLAAAGIKLGLISSMLLEGAMIDYRNLKMPLELFTILQGTEATVYHKPDPRVFEPALLQLYEAGIKKSDIVYIGDALSDFKAARDAQLVFIGVTQGFTGEKAFRAAGAHHIFSNLAEARNFILGVPST